MSMDVEFLVYKNWTVQSQTYLFVGLELAPLSLLYLF